MQVDEKQVTGSHGGLWKRTMAHLGDPCDEKETFLNMRQPDITPKKDKWIISPDSFTKATVLIVWTSFIATWSVLSLLAQDFHLCLTMVTADERVRRADLDGFFTRPHVLAVTIIDLLLIVDVVLKCRTAYIDWKGGLVTSPRKILVNHATDSFLFDLLGSLPHTLLAFTGMDPLFCMLLGMLRVLRLYPIIGPRVPPRTLQGALALFVAVFAYVFMWWFINGQNQREFGIGWMSAMAGDVDQRIQPNQSSHFTPPSSFKICSTAAQIAAGHMTWFPVPLSAIRVESSPDQWLSMISGFAGLFALISLLLAVYYCVRREGMRTDQRWSDFISFYKIPRLMRHRIWCYTRDLEVDEPNTTPIQWIGKMPPVLKEDFAMWLSQYAFSADTPLGRAFEDGTLEGQLTLRGSMVFVHVPEGTRLLEPGHRLHSLYFVYRGKMEVLTEKMYRGTAENGIFFGDLSPGTGCQRCSRVWVDAKIDCDMLKLSTAKLLKFLYTLPDRGARFFQEMNATPVLLAPTLKKKQIKLVWHNYSGPFAADAGLPFVWFKQLDFACPKDMDAAALVGPGTPVQKWTSPGSLRGCTVQQHENANGKVTLCIAPAEQKADQ